MGQSQKIKQNKWFGDLSTTPYDNQKQRDENYQTGLIQF